MENIKARLEKDIQDIDNEILRLQREQFKKGDYSNNPKIKELKKLSDDLSWDLALLEDELRKDVQIDMKKLLKNIGDFINKNTWEVFTQKEIEDFVKEYEVKCKTEQGKNEIIETLNEIYEEKQDKKALELIEQLQSKCK